MKFQWSDIAETGAVVKENVPLLAFETIMANAENQLTAKYAYLEKFDETNQLYVDQIVLTYGAVPVKNIEGEFMLIPVWAFFGGHDYGEGETMRDGERR